MKSKKSRHDLSSDESDDSEDRSESSSDSESEVSSASEHRRHKKKRKHANSSESATDSDKQEKRKRKHKKKKKKHGKRKRRNHSDEGVDSQSASDGEISSKKKKHKHKHRKHARSSVSEVEVSDHKEEVASVRSSSASTQNSARKYEKDYRRSASVEEYESLRSKEVQRFYRGSSKERRQYKQYQYDRQHDDRSRSMPLLTTDDVFPQSSDNESVNMKTKTTDSCAGKKRVAHAISHKESSSGKKSKTETKASRSQLEEDLYLSSEEEAPSEPASSKKKDAVSASQRSSKKPKLVIKPITKPARVSSKDLFGEDSGDEQYTAKEDSIPPLQSVFVNKLATGMSKQVNSKKTGAYYFDLKVYKCDEIEKVVPMNRWRHSVATIKCRTDTDTELWQHLTNVVTASRKEFRGLPNVYSSIFSMQ